MIELMIGQRSYNLIKGDTCFKNSSSCIELINKNNKYSFQSAKSFETWLSETLKYQHLSAYKTIKTTFEKNKLKEFVFERI